MTIVLSGILGMAVGAIVNLWSLRQRGVGLEGGSPLRACLAAAALGAAFVVLAARYGVGFEFLELCSFSAVLLMLSLTDIDSYRIPNGCVACALVIRACYLVFCCASGAMGLEDVCFFALSALGVGAVLCATVAACDHLLGRGSMGGGDLKLFMVAAFYFGWAQSVLLVLVACVLGIVTGTVFNASRRRASEGEGPFPFGPSIAVACVATMLCGEQLVARYAALL